jgi:hypothetical protein
MTAPASETKTTTAAALTATPPSLFLGTIVTEILKIAGIRSSQNYFVI